ncbi:MAG: preprotein translocase subunit SecG [Dysgonamonadaceae bacterium]|jgi:preprotein translocase subunit SecG|nr:preprotein translocase subunit SecG [Dysgonamonadaceae bacterium]
MGYTFLSALIVIASIALVLIVLIQNSKGGGLASSFASSNQVMGVRKTTDFLEKATWFLAGTVLVLSIFASAVIGGAHEVVQPESVMKEQIENAVRVNPNAVAPFGTQTPEATTVPTPDAQ